MRWGRIAAVCVIVGYIGLAALNLGRQILGDPAPGVTGYFFTWDMFPYYHAWSSRRTAMGKTASGKYFELVPSSAQQFRGGVNGDLTRADLERNGHALRLMADQTIAKSAASDNGPFTQVWLLEEYWPEKVNLRDDLYDQFWGSPKQTILEQGDDRARGNLPEPSTKSTKPPRTYWRILREYTPVLKSEVKPTAGDQP